MAEIIVPPLSVLMVGDEPDACSVAKETLEGAGHRVTFVEDHPSALETLAQTTPHVFIVDADRFPSSYRELVEVVRALQPETGIVLLGDSRLRGASGYLTKPLNSPELLKEVERVGQQRKTTRTSRR